MSEKLTATITFHCTDDVKRLATGLALIDGCDTSILVREVLRSLNSLSAKAVSACQIADNKKAQGV